MDGRLHDGWSCWTFIRNASLNMRNNWYISIPGLLTGFVTVALLIILPFEIAVAIIFSFFAGLFVGHYLLKLD